MVKNPLILACVAGAAMNLAGFDPKWGAERLLTPLATTRLPLGLLSVGAALKLEELRGQSGALVGNSLGRLLLMPALAFLIGQILALPAIEAATLVIFFALPTAPTA